MIKFRNIILTISLFFLLLNSVFAINMSLYRDGNEKLVINVGNYTRITGNNYSVGSSFLPYKGAIKDVNISGYNLYADNVCYTDLSNCNISGNFSDGTDTHVQGDKIYLYNDSTTIYFNETKLNNTVDERIETTFKVLSIYGSDFDSADASAERTYSFSYDKIMYVSVGGFMRTEGSCSVESTTIHYEDLGTGIKLCTQLHDNTNVEVGCIG